MLLNHRQFCSEGYGEARNGGGGKVARTKKARGKLGPPVERGWAEKWRKDLKIAGVSSCLHAIPRRILDAFFEFKRQFSRLVEMLILRDLDPTDERALRAYRLQVKERLYRFNFVS